MSTSASSLVPFASQPIPASIPAAAITPQFHVPLLQRPHHPFQTQSVQMVPANDNCVLELNDDAQVCTPSQLRAGNNDDAMLQELLDAIAQSSGSSATASAAPTVFDAKVRCSANERQPERCEAIGIVDEPPAQDRQPLQRTSLVAAAGVESSSSPHGALAVPSLVKRVTQVPG
jgi:hypothetical protein